MANLQLANKCNLFSYGFAEETGRWQGHHPFLPANYLSVPKIFPQSLDFSVLEQAERGRVKVS